MQFVLFFECIPCLLLILSHTASLVYFHNCCAFLILLFYVVWFFFFIPDLVFRTDHNKRDCFEQCILLQCILIKSYERLLFEHHEDLRLLCIFGVAFHVTFLDHEDLLCFSKNLCFPGHSSAYLLLISPWFAFIHIYIFILLLFMFVPQCFFLTCAENPQFKTVLKLQSTFVFTYIKPFYTCFLNVFHVSVKNK